MTEKTLPWNRQEQVLYNGHQLYYRWCDGQPVGDIEVFMPGGNIRKFSELRERAMRYGVRCMSPTIPQLRKWRLD